MTIGVWDWDRPDRVHACQNRHTGPCDTCGFDGVHTTRVQTMEAQQYRRACSCGTYGPVRRTRMRADIDRATHLDM